MTFFKNKFRIESIRLKGYDYSSPGEYFITICTLDKQCVLGDVVDKEMQLNEIGKIVAQCWEEIPNHFPNVELDAFVAMPNHVHGIIIINDRGRDVQLNVSTRLSPKRGSLSVIVRTFKAAVTTICRRQGYHEFGWQSRFYEHIIRSEKELNIIRDYIVNNPAAWLQDDELPK